MRRRLASTSRATIPPAMRPTTGPSSCRRAVRWPPASSATWSVWSRSRRSGRSSSRPTRWRAPTSGAPSPWTPGDDRTSQPVATSGCRSGPRRTWKPVCSPTLPRSKPTRCRLPAIASRSSFPSVGRSSSTDSTCFSSAVSGRRSCSSRAGWGWSTGSRFRYWAAPRSTAAPAGSSTASSKCRPSAPPPTSAVESRRATPKTSRSVASRCRRPRRSTSAPWCWAAGVYSPTTKMMPRRASMPAWSRWTASCSTTVSSPGASSRIPPCPRRWLSTTRR